MAPAVRLLARRLGRLSAHAPLRRFRTLPATVCCDEQMAVGEEGVSVFRVEDDAAGKTRLDAFLSGRMPGASRARLQAAVRGGLVTVNGGVPAKPGHPVRAGDTVTCRLPPPAPVEAAPEDIPLAVVYEDEHLLVVNKAAGMVVHPAPGHSTGTLVNALLHRWRLPPLRLTADGPAAAAEDDLSDAEAEDGDAAEEGEAPVLGAWALARALQAQGLRPGIVHRLDKGTTGLLVVAKDAITLAGLAEQFKAHTVERRYEAIVLGAPRQEQGRVETNIGRDVRDRKTMGAFPFQGSRGRHAISEYRVLEALAGGGAARVQWRLRTGRTHQIRVHARHLGHPLLGDEAYGGAAGSALAAIGRGKAARQAVVHSVLKGLGRPALHAKTLGFEHPRTRDWLSFQSELSQDFTEALESLRNI